MHVFQHAILTHGGAGSDPQDSDGPQSAAKVGMDSMGNGKSALNAVIQAVRYLEDDPRFNAGTGSQLRADGRAIQLDASCMMSNGKFGAVALSSGELKKAAIGRVGDVPLPGCGLFCGPVGAVACTGDGEFIALKNLAKEVYGWIERDMSPRAAAKREPAHVIGDGRSSIKNLIQKTNTDPVRGFGHEKVLTRIEIDDMTERLVWQKGLSPDSGCT